MINIRCDEKATKSVRGVAKLAALVAVLLLVFSCSGKEPLQFGTLKLSGKKIDDAVPGNGVADPKDWPKACSCWRRVKSSRSFQTPRSALLARRLRC